MLSRTGKRSSADALSPTVSLLTTLLILLEKVVVINNNTHQTIPPYYIRTTPFEHSHQCETFAGGLGMGFGWNLRGKGAAPQGVARDVQRYPTGCFNPDVQEDMRENAKRVSTEMSNPPKRGGDEASHSGVR